MKTVPQESWGRAHPSRSHFIPSASFDPSKQTEAWLPRGLGRSYGDANLKDGGTLVSTLDQTSLIEFSPKTGVLRAPSGLSLSAVLRVSIPHGWALPVTPGTKWVTLGGAIASDVHGKNHHRAGTFGRHVRRFELKRSDGFVGVCSPEQNPELFDATIGGMGLTGLITWAEIQLQRVPSSWFLVRSYPFASIAEFTARSREADEQHESTVAWVDWMRFQSRGEFCGVISAGDACEDNSPERWKVHPDPLIQIPRFWNLRVTHPFTQRLFNRLYHTMQLRKKETARVHYDTFFYPLDALDDWNRLYGSKGFFQHQAVVPHAAAETFLEQTRSTLARFHQPVYLAVVKSFGSLPSPGWLSFPREGVTTALDLPNVGARTWDCLRALNAITESNGGRCYAAKDASVSAEFWSRSYPRWQDFQAWRDPHVRSDWSARVGKSHI